MPALTPSGAPLAPSGAPMQTSARTPADDALQASARTPDHAKLRALGSRLKQTFESYERDRRPIELQWTKSARQFKGVYDPDVEAALESGRSKAYPKLTRVKCVSMLSRLMHLLFPTSEKNWSVTNTPVPNLNEADIRAVLDALMLTQQPGQPLEDVLVEMALVEFAKERSRNLEREIEDQLLEIGGSRQVDYVSLCRKVLMSGIIYGMGVLKGPFVRTQLMRTWEKQPNGLPVAKAYVAMRPQFEFVPVWDYYPDLSATYLHQMDGQFQRVVMARHQLRQLADRDDFFGDQIKQYLRDTPQGNYRRRTHEQELRAMGPQGTPSDQDGRKYEVVVWDGYISARDMQAAGFDIGEDKLHDQIEAIVWMIDGVVIKADMNPWVQLNVDQKVNTYHHFIFEEDESGLTGNGLPVIMRDSQMGVSNGTRMLLDNAGVVCGPQLEANLDLLDDAQDMTSIHAYKLWYRRGIGAEANMPAVKNVPIDSHIDELLKTIGLFRDFADTETFVNPATGGDMAKLPSEPFRTAAGASMLKGDAALPFKDVVRNFDLFTQSVIGSLVAFNAQFNPKPTIRGDHQVVPRGSTSLMAKEVRGMVLDNLAQTLDPDEKRYLNRYELLRERLAARDIAVGEVLCTKDEAKRRDAAAADAQRAEKDTTDELLRAEVRKSLAEGVKALTQSDKNAASADAQTAKTQIEVANASLEALERGLSHDQNPDRAGTAAGRRAPADAERGAAGAERQSGRPHGASAAHGMPA